PAAVGRSITLRAGSARELFECRAIQMNLFRFCGDQWADAAEAIFPQATRALFPAGAGRHGPEGAARQNLPKTLSGAGATGAGEAPGWLSPPKPESPPGQAGATAAQPGGGLSRRGKKAPGPACPKK